MIVLCTLLAETVSRDPFSIHNVLDTLRVADLHDHTFGYAVVFQATPDDYGAQHQLSCRIIDEEGQLVGGATFRKFVVPNPPDLPDKQLNHAGTLRVTFPRFGEYQVEMSLDGQLLRSLPLRVRAL